MVCPLCVASIQCGFFTPRRAHYYRSHRELGFEEEEEEAEDDEDEELEGDEEEEYSFEGTNRRSLRGKKGRRWVHQKNKRRRGKGKGATKKSKKGRGGSKKKSSSRDKRLRNRAFVHYKVDWICEGKPPKDAVEADILYWCDGDGDDDYSSVAVSNGRHVSVADDSYYKCGASWYQRGYSGSQVTYIQVAAPPGF